MQCSRCGTVNDGTTFCRACGTPLVSSGVPEPYVPAVPDADRHLLTVLGGITAALVVAVVVLGIVIAAGRGTERADDGGPGTTASASTSSTTTTTTSPTTTSTTSTTTTVPPTTNTLPPPTATTQPPTTTTTAVPPTLGAVWAPYQQGYGEVAPKTIFNGGDPTGLVDDITWQNWGASTATGTGTGLYVGPDQFVYQGQRTKATVVAYNLGTCHGHPAYLSVTWYFPSKGENFNPVDSQYALCP